MPENDWQTWYEQAYWQYQYSPSASSGYNTQNANFPASLEWDIEGDGDLDLLIIKMNGPFNKSLLIDIL